MPPKKAEKAPVVDLSGQDVRSVSVRVEGLLEGKLDEPHFCVSLPGEEDERKSMPITQCWDFEGTWREPSRGEGRVRITRNADNDGVTAANDTQQLWRTTAAIPLTEACQGERLRIIDAHRSTWEPVEIRALNTNVIDVDGATYRRQGINTAFAFHTKVFTLENIVVNPKAIREVLAKHLTLKVMSKQVNTAASRRSVADDAPPNPKDKKKAGKPAAKKGAEAPPAEVFACVAETTFSFVPLCVGAKQYVFTHKDGSEGKARCAVPHFPELRVVVESAGGKFGEAQEPMTLLTEQQATQWMPLCVTVLSVADVPDSRPISIHPSEMDERPLVDTIAKQTPCYRQMRAQCQGVYVTCPILPGAPPVHSPPVPHERNPGIYHHQLYLLGDLEATTGGAMKDPLTLLRYVWDTDMRIELHDRQGGAPGFGVADCSLRPLLTGAKENNEHPTMKLALQVAQHRAEVAEDDGDGDGKPDGGENPDGEAALDASVAPDAPPDGAKAADAPTSDAAGATGSGVYLGQYMSWGTTVAMKVEIGARLPRLSFENAARQAAAANAAVAGAVLAAALAEVDPSLDYAMEGLETVQPSHHSGSLAFDDAASQTGGSKLLRSLKAKGLLRPRFAARGFEQKEAAPGALPQFSRLVIRIRYASRSTRRVLHAIMHAITQCPRAGRDDDVKLFAPPPAEPEQTDEPPAKDTKKGGGKAAKGRPGTAGKDTEPRPDTAPMPQNLEDMWLVQVSAGVGLSGFEFIDDDWRVIVLEGMTTTTLQPILDAVHEEIHNMDLYSGDVSIVFNPHLTFPARAYCDWPPLVPHAPPKPAKADLMDAGAVGNRIRRVRLAKSLQAVSDTLPNYIKRRVSTGVLAAVRRLLNLRGVTTMQEAIDMGAFPTAKSLILLERMYGTTLSSYDVCGDETFYPLSVPLPSAYGMHDADRVVSDDAGASPYGAVSPQGTSGTGAGSSSAHPSRPTTSFSSRRGGAKDTDAQDLPAPTSIEELQNFVGKEIVVVGRPAPTHGRRALGASAGRGDGMTAAAATIGNAGGQRLYLHVPDLRDHVLLLFSKLARPLKPVAVRVEGKIVRLEGEDDDVAIQVYRWAEHINGGLAGASHNHAFLKHKQQVGRKLDYTHYTDVEHRRQQLRDEEAAKRAATQRREEDGDSSGSECDLGGDVYVPPRLPVVETDYHTLNQAAVAKQSQHNVGARQRQERYAYHSGATPTPTQQSCIATRQMTEKERLKMKADETAFSQLQGGWRPMVEEDVHPGIPVRVKRDLRKGKLMAFDKGVVTVEFPAEQGGATTAAGGERKGGVGIDDGTQTTRPTVSREGGRAPFRARFAMGHLEVTSKSNLYDNRHPKKLPASRLADLHLSWDPVVENPFLRSADTSMDMKRPTRNTTALFSGDWGSGLNEPYAPPRGPHTRDPDAGEPPPVFHVSKKSHGHPLDKTRGMLFDKPQKAAIAARAPDAPPLSIYKPEDSKRVKPEVSTVYYASKSHTWRALENKDKPRIKAVDEHERRGDVW